MDLSLGRLALALAASSAFCAPAFAQGEVTGFVFTAGSGAPIEGATVSVEGGPSTTTDRYGSYRLELEAGTWTLTVRAPGIPDGRFEGVEVVDGVATEVLVTLDPDNAQVEAPDEDAGPREQVDPDGPVGVLQGRVVDADDSKKSVIGARIFVRGLAVEAVTDATGQFVLELPPGDWELSILKSGYSTRSVPGVHIESEATTPLTVNLVPAGLRLAEFVITAPAIVGGTADLLEERKDSATVGDVLGAEQMSRSGDSNAASALKRVTGLTVVGGKFVYVRGLGERYSASLLNGAQIPSPEPERRVVPLDMIPASVLESVVIQKTFSPDMPAEFGGGVVQLRTRRPPAEPFFNVSLSGAINTFTTFKQGYRYATGPTDWLGIDGGFRDLPPEIAAASADEKIEPGDMFSDAGYTAEELEAFGEMMPNNWEIWRKTLGPDVGGSISGGGTLDFGNDVRLGLLGAVSYNHGWDYQNFDRTYYLIGDDEQLEAAHTYNFESATREVGLGGLAVAALEVGDDHKITLTSFLNRSTDDEARVYQGANRDVATEIAVTRLRWVERQLLTEQLMGSHTIPGLADFTIDWRYTYSNATRNEPDRREYRFDYENGEDGGSWFLSDRPEGNQRFFSVLNDDIHDVGLDLTQPFTWWRGLEGRVKVGGMLVDRARTVDTRRFKFMHKGGAATDYDVISSDIQDIFNEETIAPGSFQFEETTLTTDNYQASQRMYAGYALIDAYVLPDTRVLAGARVESSSQSVTTFELFNPDAEPVVALLETLDVLPALTLTQEISETMQVRAGYGRTVSRPDFRELSPATFNDVTGGRQRFGNADLLRATIDNFDLRWEWYPSPGESVSVGAFYKRFSDPIETIVIASAQLSVTYDNVLGADNVGVELDARKNLSFLPGAWQDVYVAGNLSLIYSQVRIDEEGTGVQSSSVRALQGQSPYVINAQVGYADPEGIFSTAVLYNVFGPRIVEVGALGSPDTFELPVHQLDVTAAYTIPAGLTISAKAKNLLDWPVRFKQGDSLTESNFRGREFSLGLSFKI